MLPSEAIEPIRAGRVASYVSTDASADPESEAAVTVPTDGPVLLFDGVCNLCTGTVQWVIERDPEGTFRFASLQSDAGQALLEAFDLPTDGFDSFVLVDGDDYYAKSEAALRVAKRLGLPYSALTPFLVVPPFIRDRVYDLVAANRYRIFGRRESCMMPSPEVEDRFLE
jgi:predicted DCC family thiol-disulfide oxidoreductase YuxK